MPELPEVETIVRGLDPGLRERAIAGTELLFPPLLRRASARDLAALVGKRIAGVRRRGKMIVIECRGGPTLVFHLKMTGQLLLAEPGAPRDKHTRLVITFADAASELHFRDIRKFGFLLCLAQTPHGTRAGHDAGAADTCAELASLGPEPLAVTSDEFAGRFAGKKARIKGLLLDQTIVAGIGNIYADEILFDARIQPETPASSIGREGWVRLWKSTRRILNKAIRAKGSTVRDYVDTSGRAGRFQFSHRVYDREGEPCRACRTPIKRIRVAGRSTYFCPSCQRKRRRVVSTHITMLPKR